MAGEIVLGYDGTECAEAALEVAVSLASDLGAKLVITYAYDPARIGGEVRDLDIALEKRGEEVTAQAAGKAAAAGVQTETEILKMKPSHALSDLARERGARFIVLGSYGERPATGAILGSTPHKLLHISEVPVIVVPVQD
ncbi:MAG: universal stress protein [Solirubrobacterales bacterium]